MKKRPVITISVCGLDYMSYPWYNVGRGGVVCCQGRGEEEGL